MRLLSSILLLSLSLLTTNGFGKTWNDPAVNTVWGVEDTSQFLQLCQPATDAVTLTTTAPAGGTWTASCGTCVSPQGVVDPAGLNAGSYLFWYAQSGSTDTVLLTIFPQPGLELSGKDSVNCGENVVLTASGAQSYAWTPAGILSCAACENPEYRADTSTTFTVVGTDANGCTNTATIRVNVRPMLEVIMPNAFTPNGDQSNDIFRPTCRFNIFREYHLRVFSRWGELVYETYNIGEGWDGTKDGSSPMASDVYVYTFEYTLINGDKNTVSKDVTLLR